MTYFQDRISRVMSDSTSEIRAAVGQLEKMLEERTEALQEIGRLLALPAGADLTKDCAPAIERLVATVRRGVAPAVPTPPSDAEMNVALENMDTRTAEGIKAFGVWCVESASIGAGGVHVVTAADIRMNRREGESMWDTKARLERRGESIWDTKGRPERGGDDRE